WSGTGPRVRWRPVRRAGRSCGLLSVVEVQVPSSDALEGPTEDAEDEGQTGEDGEDQVVVHEGVAADRNGERSHDGVPRLAGDVDAARVELAALFRVRRCHVHGFGVLL